MVTMARRQLWQARSLHGEEIAKRHATAAELVRGEQAAVCPVPDTTLPTWEVRSGADDSSRSYRVEQEHRQCPEIGCQQRCQECRACVHHFRCSCPDWTGHKLMCKHIHIVCLLVDGLSDSLSQLSVPEPQITDDSLPGMADDPPPPPPLSRPADKQRMLAKLAAVSAELSAVPEGSGALFDAALVKLDELSQLAKAMSHAADVPSQQLGGTSNRPWNARIESQPCFRPPRAKRPRVAPSVVQVDSAAASELVASLSRGDSGRERVPQVHQDHPY